MGYTAYDGMMIVKVLVHKKTEKIMINITPPGWLLNGGPPEYKAGFLITLSQKTAAWCEH